MKIEMSRQEWNAIKLFIREEELTLKGNYGIPGRAARTWEKEAMDANPNAFAIFDAARKAIRKAKIVQKA